MTTQPLSGSPPQAVTVSPADLDEVIFDGSVIVVTGSSEDGRSRITFAGETRPMRELLFAVAESGGPQTAVVEAWQITGQRPIEGGAR